MPCHVVSNVLPACHSLALKLQINYIITCTDDIYRGSGLCEASGRGPQNVIIFLILPFIDETQLEFSYTIAYAILLSSNLFLNAKGTSLVAMETTTN